nr:hypothetical protein [Myxococcota bacterium]
MRTTTGSGLLQFTRDGRHLLASDADGVTVIDVDGGGRRRIACAEVQAVAALPDQVWIATRAGTLIRTALDGRRLGEHALTVDGDAVLIATTVGAPAALWTAAAPSILVDDLGTLAVLAIEPDALVPVAGRRYVRAAGPRLTLPTGAWCTFAQGARIKNASVLFDGTSLAVVSGDGQRRTLLVVTLASGRIQQTLAMTGELVAVAGRRGIAVIRERRDRLRLLDLRFGRSLGTLGIAEDHRDVAIDPDGRVLAVRLAGGELELAAIGERLAAGA